MNKKSMTRIGDAEVQHPSSSVPEQSSSENWEIRGLGSDELGPTLTVADKLSNQASNNGRVVVLNRMFTLEELEEGPSLLLDLKEAVRGEFRITGDVINPVFYDARGLLFVFPSETPSFPSPLHLLVRLCSKSRRTSWPSSNSISTKACPIVRRPFHHSHLPSDLAHIPGLQKMQGRFFAGRRVEPTTLAKNERRRRGRPGKRRRFRTEAPRQFRSVVNG